VIAFSVLGKPATAGNKRALPFRRGDGSLGVRVIEGRDRKSNEHSKTWRSDVRDAARAAYSGEPLTAPLRLELVFVLPRPSNHFRSNGELSKAGRERPHPTTRPDSTKLLRAFEDALTGITWADDSQIVEHVVRKVYGDRLETRAKIEEVA
jgi:Holliday junction resolvase RusA-like endonuclease